MVTYGPGGLLAVIQLLGIVLSCCLATSFRWILPHLPPALYPSSLPSHPEECDRDYGSR